MKRFSFPNILQLVTCQILILDRLQSTSGLVTLIHNSTLTDPWTFQEGDNVTLTCTIQPYNNFQIWRFNSSSVSSCGLISCSVTNNKNGNFIFQQNTGIGEFFWHISPMQLEYNNAEFECSDGTPAGTVSKTATVTQRLTKQATTPDSSNIGAIVGGSVGGGIGGLLFIAAIVIAIVYIYYAKVAKPPAKPSDFTAQHLPLVKWNRGDNGGLRQTFIININSSLTNKTTIKYFEVKDTHKKDIEHQLTGLPEECCYLVLFAKNLKGNSEEVKIHVPGLPYPPKTFVETKLLNKSVVLQWEPLICLNCGEQSYQIILLNKQSGTPLKKNIAGGTVKAFTDLLSDTEYEATITARYNRKVSNNVSCSFKTLEDPKPANQVSVTAETNTIFVSWKAAHNQGFPQQFTVSYKEENTNEWTPTELLIDVSLMYSHEINNLKERTFYYVKIESTSELGPTMDGPYKTETKGKPDPPNDVHTTYISDTELCMHWSRGSNGGFEQTFTIEETKNRIERIQNIKDIHDLKMTHEVSGLSPNTNYDFRVGSTNREGTSWSNPVKYIYKKNRSLPSLHTDALF